MLCYTFWLALIYCWSIEYVSSSTCHALTSAGWLTLGKLCVCTVSWKWIFRLYLHRSRSKCWLNLKPSQQGSREYPFMLNDHGFWLVCTMAWYNYGITVCALYWRNLTNTMVLYVAFASTISNLSSCQVAMTIRSRQDCFSYYYNTCR